MVREERQERKDKKGKTIKLRHDKKRKSIRFFSKIDKKKENEKTLVAIFQPQPT